MTYWQRPPTGGTPEEGKIGRVFYTKEQTLRGAKEILAYIGWKSVRNLPHLIYRYGLPVRKLQNKLFAYKPQLDEWLSSARLLNETKFETDLIESKVSPRRDTA